MPRVFLYAASPGTRDAIASMLEDDGEIELHDGGDRAPRRIEGSREDDVLMMALDLPVVERLQILGLVWRTEHPPRTLFFDCGPDAGRAGPCAVDPGDRKRCLAAVRALAEGESTFERLALSLRAAPAAGERVPARLSTAV